MRLVALITTAVMLLAAAPVLAEAIAPLALNNAAVGGAALNQYTPGVENGTGVNNIGLLIKTWGKVTFVDPANKYFYINDGSNRQDGSGQIGLRIDCDNLAPGNTITPPAVNTYVMVTGISSTIVIDTKIQPNVRARRQADIQTVTP
jgi:hypothetical protein